jgi:hypothetical protein
MSNEGAVRGRRNVQVAEQWRELGKSFGDTKAKEL